MGRHGTQPAMKNDVECQGMIVTHIDKDLDAKWTTDVSCCNCQKTILLEGEKGEPVYILWCTKPYPVNFYAETLRHIYTGRRLSKDQNYETVQEWARGIFYCSTCINGVTDFPTYHITTMNEYYDIVAKFIMDELT